MVRSRDNASSPWRAYSARTRKRAGAVGGNLGIESRGALSCARPSWARLKADNKPRIVASRFTSFSPRTETWQRRRDPLERPGEWLPLVGKCHMVFVIKTHDAVNNDTAPGPGSDSRSPCRP